MKSNLAIIEDNAKFNLAKSDPKPKVQTVAKGVKLPTLKESNPIFDRPFGKEGHTLGEAIEHQASVYNSIVKQRKNQLEKLKGIGEVLIELRSVSGASDKAYGILVSKTPLAVMTRQDRFDAVWLAENWTNVQTYMKEMDISSGSAAYLRQKIKSAKPTVEASSQEPKTDAKPSAGVQSSEKKETTPTIESKTPASDEPSAVESSQTTEVSVDNEDDFALSMAQIVEQSGLDLKKVINALLKLA
jgi:hypothetical protein